MRLRTAPVLLALAIAFLAGDAAALGFGAARTSAVLGQPLRLQLPLILDGEPLEPQCVSAQVVAGEQRLSPQQVRTSLEPGANGLEAVVRVVTTVAIEEPVVEIDLSVGCPVRLQRRLVALVDPPTLVNTPTEPLATPVDAAGRPLVEAPLPRAVPPRSADKPSSAPRRTAAARKVSPSTTAAASPAAASSGSAGASSEPLQPARREAAARRGGARLQLDAGEGGTAPTGAAATASALEAAQAQVRAAQAAAVAAESAASAAAERLRGLEQGMGALQAEARMQREQIERLQRQLIEAQGRSAEPAWWPWLLVAVLAVACLLLARRLREQSRDRAGWLQAQGKAVPDPITKASGFDAMQGQAAMPPPANTAPVPALPPPPVAAPAPKPVAPPVVLPIASPVAAETRRGLTIEEHIDLEQQADFFLVLGQDDEAVDLLLTQLRGTGGTSPMPYLKLMQIYRRHDDEVAYERTRERFEQRFHANVPRWAAADMPQRSLEAYPQALQRLQQVWAQPLDAMAEIEALLFRRGEPHERFDLAAYEDLLFLYWLTRELQQSDADEAPPAVDVLLPIDDGSEAATPLAEPLRPAAPMPAVEPEADAAARLDALDLVLDLDVPPAPPAAARTSAPAPPDAGQEGQGAPSLELLRDERDHAEPDGQPRPSRR